MIFSGGTAPQTNFVTVYAFFSKITTHWWQVRYVSYTPRKLLLHWNFTYSSGNWFMAQNMENTDFCTYFIVTSQQWSLLKWNCDFLVPMNISDQIHGILCPKLLNFFEKMHKIFKNKGPVVQYPLNPNKYSFGNSVYCMIWVALAHHALAQGWYN